MHFLLLPGAGGAGDYWKRVVPMLEAAGHSAVAIDLPGADESAGLEAYAEIAVRAAGARDDVVLVAQSMGGFTAPLVAERVALRRLVLANAMIPVPGETPGEWWGNTGSEEARVAAARAGGYAAEFDLALYFVHDLPEELAKEVLSDTRGEGKAAFRSKCAFESWPSIPIDVLIGEDDRFFPAAFQERVARERLGERIRRLERVRGGHLAALSYPADIARCLLTE